MDLRIFNSVTTPLELLCRLTLDQRHLGKHSYTTCPSCGEPMWVLPQSFVCAHYCCSLRAASPLDFLRIKYGSFAAAGSVLLDLFPERLGQVSPVPRDALLDELEAQSMPRRHLLDFFLKRRMSNGRGAFNEAIQAKMELEKEGVDMDSCRSSIFILLRDDIDELESVCGRLGIDVPDLPHWVYIAVPYFTHHSRLSAILLSRPGRSQGSQWIQVEPSRLSFAGLWDGDSRCDNPYLCKDFKTAGFVASRGQRMGDSLSCYSALLNIAGMPGALPFERGVYLIQPEETFPLAADLFHSLKTLTVDTEFLETGLAGTPAPWESFLVNRLVSKLVQERTLNSVNQTLLISARPTNAMKFTIIDELRKAHLFRLAEEVDALYRQGPVWHTDKVDLFSTPSGYYSTTKSAIHKTEITNFTLDLHHNITFKDSSDLFHEGWMHFNRNAYPAVFRDRDFDSARTLEAAVRLVEAKLPQLRGETHLLPAVTDKSGLKHVLALLQSATAGLPLVEGVPHLGWSADRSQFYGRSWYATADRIISTPDRPVHPAYEHFKYFSVGDDETTSVNYAEVPRGLKELIAQIIGITARVYFRHAVSPITVKNTPENRTILAELFKAVGQINPIVLQFNTRASEEFANLHGCPAYAFGYSEGQIAQSRLGLVVLSDIGADFTGTVSPETLAITRGVFRHVLSRFLPWFISTQGQHHRPSSFVTYEGAVLREGAEMIAQATGSVWLAIKTGQTVLEKLLASIPTNSTEQFITHDLAEQKVIIKYTGLPAFNTTDLQLELSGITTLCRVTDSCIEIDALSGIQILQSYYQGIPRVTVRASGVEFVPRQIAPPQEAEA